MTHITIYTSMPKYKQLKTPTHDATYVEENIDKLYPKCHPYWIVDGKRVENPDVKTVAYTAQGYLLPCCWCDSITDNRKRHPMMEGLYDEQLKVENVDDIEQDILNSPEWYYFHNTLLQNPQNAPFICKHKCSKMNLNERT